jgi:PhzF family phenazine biosynthesis protein
MLSFSQVDVFTAAPYRGNPVAVVHGADAVSDVDMARFANWTNLSETTFLLAPTDPAADYRVRIFTPGTELPFAGHPTIGTCHAWLEAGGAPKDPTTIVQECGVGLVQLRRSDGRLAFAAPPLQRSGAVDEAIVERAAAVLGVDRSAIVDANWCDNGPRWIGVQLADAEAVLDLRPNFGVGEGTGVGVVGPDTIGAVGLTGTVDPGEPAIEVRAFFSSAGQPAEDPVTGSLNAGLAQWLLGNGTLSGAYVASQGTALGRAGRVHITPDADVIWVGGDAVTCVAGTVQL